MATLALIVAMAVVTFLTRYVALAAASQVALPDWCRRALGYVPPAVLTAIIVPAVLSPRGALDLSLQNSYLVGGAVAMVVAWRTRQLLPTIAVGMVVFWLARVVLV